MSIEKASLKGTWEVSVKNHETGEETVFEDGNLIVDVGRIAILRALFGMTVVTFPYLAVGKDSTAAAATQTALVSEITDVSSPAGSETARLSLTDAAGGSIDVTDITADTSVSPYREKIILKAVYDDTMNNGTTFREFAVMSSATFGAGDMLNRFVLGADIAKTSAISVTCTITFRT